MQALVTKTELIELLPFLTEQEQDEIARLIASEPDSFGNWLPRITPSFTWDWQHLAYIRQNLQMVTDGIVNKMMLFVPPRHGKSQMVTVRYPVWRLEQDPVMNVIVGAYSQTLANRFSRVSRKIARERIALDDERRAVEEWSTAAGGIYRAVGVGGGITGQGGDLIIIDDPVKNREEANSPTYRQKVWDWYTDDLFTRLEPGAAMILIMTRWHDDDLAGRILASEDGPNWTVVKLPAEAEEDDPLGRGIGEALCPDRYDVDALQSIHRVLGNSYHALYQQRPQALEGSMFKRHWFEIVREVPAKAKRIRWWDRAATSGGGDYTAGVLLAYADGVFYVEDVVRGQWSSRDRDKTILQTAEQDDQRYDDVEQWTEQEPGSSGKDAALAFVRLLTGFRARYRTSTGSKEVRADPFAAQAEAGNVKIKKAPWNGAYLDELTTFPTGVNDDQVDGSSGAANRLARGNNAYGWEPGSAKG